MKTLEFVAQVNADSTLKIPASVASQIQQQQNVHVVILIPELDEDKLWNRVTVEQMFKGYSDSDSIYDKLSSR